MLGVLSSAELPGQPPRSAGGSQSQLVCHLKLPETTHRLLKITRGADRHPSLSTVHRVLTVRVQHEAGDDVFQLEEHRALENEETSGCGSHHGCGCAEYHPEPATDALKEN